MILNLGLSAATENSLKTLLNESNHPAHKSNRDGCTVNVVVLVACGLRESHAFIPNTYRCVIGKRRGFVRIALETGASLVPTISFGENSIYKEVNLSGSFSRTIKYLFKRFFPYVSGPEFLGQLCFEIVLVIFFVCLWLIFAVWNICTQK